MAVGPRQLFPIDRNLHNYCDILLGQIKWQGFQE